MHIRTMATQINEQTWPVAVACLGGTFASIPFNEVDGAYLVINTPHRGPGRGIRYGAPADPARTITLGNAWLEAEDFEHMYSWDKRSSLVKGFVDVTLAESRPRKLKRDKTGEQIQKLFNDYFGDESLDSE